MAGWIMNKDMDICFIYFSMTLSTYIWGKILEETLFP